MRLGCDKRTGYSKKLDRPISFEYPFPMSRHVTVSPEILSGTPVFTGTRVPIKNLFDYIETGSNIDEFLDDFPTVSKEIAVAVLQEAEHLLLTV